MTTVVACPDKFRGTLLATEAAAACAEGARRAGADRVVELPLADGGEGTLDTLLAVRGGTRRVARVSGPLGDPVDAEWGLLRGGDAVVEMARASGLALVAHRNDPLAASTRGTGELIAAARAAGARRILVGVGGSATTDGGLGAVDALGWSLHGLEVTVACDVTTPFTDAAAVFGPQKGASDAQVALLGRRLERLADQYRERTGVDVGNLEGAGAAGGLAGGLAALGASLRPGFDVVAGAVGLDAAIADADLVLTGEGRLDGPSLDGKVVGGVIDWAAADGVPVGVIAGQVTRDARARLAAEHPDVIVRALVDRVPSASEAFRRTGELVADAAAEIGVAVLSGGGGPGSSPR